MEAAKLAHRLLQDHASEGTFEVAFDAFDDLDLLAHRFREAGCAVEIDRMKRALNVTPPARTHASNRGTDD